MRISDGMQRSRKYLAVIIGEAGLVPGRYDLMTIDKVGHEFRCRMLSVSAVKQQYKYRRGDVVVVEDVVGETSWRIILYALEEKVDMEMLNKWEKGLE